MMKEEVDQMRSGGDAGHVDDAEAVFEQVALGEDFVEFLTLPAYEALLASEE
jgi:hypothetical protein